MRLCYACMNADRTLTAPFVRRSWNASVICVVRREHCKSCLHYDVVYHLRYHAMRMLQTGVQLRSDIELILFMDVAVQHGMLHFSWVGIVPRPWRWWPSGGRSWPGSLRLPTGTPADRSGAGPAWRSLSSIFHRETWAQRTPATGGR